MVGGGDVDIPGVDAAIVGPASELVASFDTCDGGDEHADMIARDMVTTASARGRADTTTLSREEGTLLVKPAA
jgi:hypothetical protein